MSDIQETNSTVETTESSNQETPTPTPTVEETPTPPAQEAPVPDATPDNSSQLTDLLSDELKTSKALGNFKDVDGLAKSYVHLNSMLGKRFDELSPEELKGYYSKMGRPEEPDKYELPVVANNELDGWYRDNVFKLGLNQKQARSLMESYTELEQMKMQEMTQQNEAMTNEWEQGLKQEFGTAFEQRVDTAKKAVKEFGGEELRDYLNETGLGNHPAMVKAFAKIGQNLKEDTLTDTQVSANFGTTPNEALQKISNLKRDPNFMKSYRSAMDPGHKGAVKEIEDLYKIAYPDDD